MSRTFPKISSNLIDRFWEAFLKTLLMSMNTGSPLESPEEL
ncbi:hypothetical protein AM1_C0364 (plasmid) [Acaryochloris marina MBIC11017]|uniref:Uncharacterized protein n=1 Tax=Acaryochloris marina (strain MBIC 11017) TaxID=329726 RepID=A8ZL16_ACAM1|nr:hypothetical protein AM1_A0366 [Acaryochloris marina MBIC11017]ABW32291.1 hypothetical protein AM1_C0364 [Acaryochloris marina MBIC11017]